MTFCKSTALLTVSLILGLFIVSCRPNSIPTDVSTSVPTDVPTEEVVVNQLPQGEWELVSYGDPDNPITPLQDRQPTISFEDPSVTGFTGCNNYWGVFAQEGDGLQIQDIAVTEEFCDQAGVMDQEDEFLRLLNSVERFGRGENVLTLSGPEGSLRFEPPSTPEPQPLEGLLWQLEQFVTFEGEVVIAEVALERFPITAWFEDGQLSGSTGCNTYGAPYATDGDQIEFTDDFFMTEAECLDEGANQQESRYLQDLQSVRSYQVEGETLTLAFPGGELVFHPQPDPGRDENAVYEALLAEWGEGPFVLLDQTAFNRPGVSLEATMEVVQEQLSTMFQGEEDPFALLDETLEDFKTKNAEASSLGDFLQTRFTTILLTEAEIQERFEVNGEIDWVAFEAEFPGEEGIYSLSRVGFNANGDQALVYLGLRGEGFTGGWYSLMYLDRGSWMSTISFLIWQQ